MIVIAEPDECRKSLYARHLGEGDYQVVVCGQLENLPEMLRENKPHLLVLSSEFPGYLNRIVSYLRKIKSVFPDLHIITIGFDLHADVIKQFMQHGVVSHIDRKFSRPHDLTHIVKIILSN